MASYAVNFHTVVGACVTIEAESAEHARELANTLTWNRQFFIDHLEDVMYDVDEMYNNLGINDVFETDMKPDIDSINGYIDNL